MSKQRKVDEPLETYGLKFKNKMNQWFIELYCFRIGHPLEKGGLGKYEHLRKACAIAFPDKVWNPWMEEKIKCLCDDDYAIKIGATTQRYVSWAGCKTAAKTHDSAFYAFMFWLAAPKETIVVLTSTTGKMVRKRTWPELQKLYREARDNLTKYFGIPATCGNLVDSKTTLQAERGDDKHSISAIAVKEGRLEDAVANIVGQHAPRILVVVDEATDVPPAIMVACENLKGACQDFTLLVMGNSKSRMDPHGKACEPKDGWDSVNKNTGEWRTKKGICQHFAGSRSPNVKAKKTLYPYIYTYEDYLTAKSESSEDSLTFWMYEEGFWPPDGVCRTVVSELMLIKYGAYSAAIFSRGFVVIGALDPGFGGDDCILKFARFGMMDSGKMGISITESIKIEISAISKDEPDYQIAHRVIDECGKRGCKPQHFGSDATGTGRGVYAILAQEWSREVVRVEFGGNASDLPSSIEDPRPCSEIYDRRVTELAFACRSFVLSGQLRGLDQASAVQMCGREYRMVGKPEKYRIETKDEYKQKFSRSPDDADCVAVMVEVARVNGAVPALRLANNDSQDWITTAKEAHAILAVAEIPDQESGFIPFDPWGESSGPY